MVEHNATGFTQFPSRNVVTFVQYQIWPTSMSVGQFKNATAIGLKDYIRIYKNPEPKNHGHQIAKRRVRWSF